MAYRNIRQWPNEVLSRKSELVLKEEIKDISEDLIDTLKVISGLGLAAPQIGILKKVVVIDISSLKLENPDKDISDSGFWTFSNPHIYGAREKVKWKEACLSVPQTFCLVQRSTFINLDYDDLNGDRKSIKLSPPLSMAVQHEVDHLEGKTILDRVSTLNAQMFKKKIKKFALKEQRRSENLEENEKIIGKPKNKKSLSPKEKRKRKTHKRTNSRKK